MISHARLFSSIFEPGFKLARTKHSVRQEAVIVARQDRTRASGTSVAVLINRYHGRFTVTNPAPMIRIALLCAIRRGAIYKPLVPVRKYDMQRTAIRPFPLRRFIIGEPHCAGRRRRQQALFTAICARIDFIRPHISAIVRGELIAALCAVRRPTRIMQRRADLGRETSLRVTFNRHDVE